MSQITHRAFGGHDDFMAVRQFLRDSYTGYDWMFNWGIDRWDVVRYSGNAACELTGDRIWEQYVRVWEDDGRIVGVIHPEDGGDLFVDVDAAYRDLENEMYAWGESNPSPPRREGSPLSTWAQSVDTHRSELLLARGWRRIGPDGFTRRRSLETQLPDGPVAEGYTVRSIDLARDAEQRAAVSRSAFGSKRTAELAKVLAQAPTYRADLDLAAVADDGTFAANTTVWLDDVNRYAVFEPVGTHSEHRRRGLASAVIAEGMRRAVALGATVAYVGSGEGSPANALYERLGFVDADTDELWQKDRDS
ncbi:MAG: GNAT family N-acetyltransferase [bacterium]|nr:GNAT family N-acetyltransferase [bacterium]